MNFEKLNRKTTVGLVALSVLAGGIGGTVLSAVAAHAQTSTPAVVTAQVATPTPMASTTPSIDNAPNYTFHSNEDPAHEKGESAAREAQEDAGQRPTAQ